MSLIETPPLTIACPWCNGGVSINDVVCPSCSMPISQRSNPIPSKKAIKKIESTEKRDIHQEIKDAKARGRIVAVGIDPGARYVGFSIRDDEDTVFMSSTFYRPDEVSDSVEWAKKTVIIIQEELVGIDYDIMGIEGVTDPKGFKKGKKDALNPKDIIRTGIVVGALAISYPQAYIIRPRGNGDRPLEEYPSDIQGQRPKNLPGRRDAGVTVRKHERSAYDVAEHAIFQHIQEQ